MGLITLEGKIKSGRDKGKNIGFSTINIDIPKVIKKDQWGVYLSLITIRDRIYPAITHLGPPKTFSLGRATCESHLLTFRGNLYGQLVRKKLVFKLRDIHRFPSVKELRKQIKKDIRMAKKFFGL